VAEGRVLTTRRQAGIVNKKTRSSALLALIWGVASAAIGGVLFYLGASEDSGSDLRTAATRLGVAALVVAVVGVVGGAWILARGRHLPVVGVLVASIGVGCAAVLVVNGLFADSSLIGISLPLVFVAAMVWLETAGRKDPEGQH